MDLLPWEETAEWQFRFTPLTLMVEHPFGAQFVQLRPAMALTASGHGHWIAVVGGNPGEVWDEVWRIIRSIE